MPDEVGGRTGLGAVLSPIKSGGTRAPTMDRIGRTACRSSEGLPERLDH